ncbi:MAG: carotenoid 1,2-hydratase [Rhodocyclaceae bacterium]|nr:carotenoid 1,2-hydratase [Rhodocyclaceae bacterium]
MRCLLLWALVLPLALFAAEYPPVRPGVPVNLPADHGAHPDYRTEWWYVTGWLTDEQGRERGFQITFFRVRSGLGEPSKGRFSPAQLIFAHAAIADPARGRLRHAQRSARASGRLAGSAIGGLDVWLEGWSLRARDSGYRALARGEDFALDLTLAPTRDPLLQGDAGFSQKGPTEAHASYYYSLPALAVSGAIELDGASLAVSGEAWLDHEWSSALMPEGAVGWDWTGINLSDGGALMAFRMRDAEGGVMWSSGTLRDSDGGRRILTPQDLALAPGRRWTSPRTGTAYPVEWTLRLGARTLTLAPLMDDQELDARGSTGAVYWEGAVRVLEQGAVVGRGYLEMTGYAGRLEL